MKIKGSNVLITGGASGIGKIMGRMALEKGARNLIIWDINIAAIEAVKQEFKELGNVYGYRVDVSSNDTVVNTYKRVLEDCGEVDILINCAGIVTSNKTFDQMSADEITRTININTIAPMFVAHALPILWYTELIKVS